MTEQLCFTKLFLPCDKPKATRMTLRSDPRGRKASPEDEKLSQEVRYSWKLAESTPHWTTTSCALLLLLAASCIFLERLCLPLQP